MAKELVRPFDSCFNQEISVAYLQLEAQNPDGFQLHFFKKSGLFGQSFFVYGRKNNINRLIGDWTDVPDSKDIDRLWQEVDVQFDGFDRLLVSNDRYHFLLKLERTKSRFIKDSISNVKSLELMIEKPASPFSTLLTGLPLEDSLENSLGDALSVISINPSENDHFRKCWQIKTRSKKDPQIIYVLYMNQNTERVEGFESFLIEDGKEKIISRLVSIFSDENGQHIPVQQFYFGNDPSGNLRLLRCSFYREFQNSASIESEYLKLEDFGYPEPKITRSKSSAWAITYGVVAIIVAAGFFWRLLRHKLASE